MGGGGGGRENRRRRAGWPDNEVTIRLLENGQFAGRDVFWRAESSLGDCEPGHLMIRRRLIDPSLTGRESNIKVVDALRSIDCALGSTIGAYDNPRGLFFCHLSRTQGMTLAGRVLEFRRQRDPQLESFG